MKWKHKELGKKIIVEERKIIKSVNGHRYVNTICPSDNRFFSYVTILMTLTQDRKYIIKTGKLIIEAKYKITDTNGLAIFMIRYDIIKSRYRSFNFYYK